MRNDSKLAGVYSCFGSNKTPSLLNSGFCLPERKLYNNWRGRDEELLPVGIEADYVR
jgi:hypothetical protein